MPDADRDTPVHRHRRRQAHRRQHPSGSMALRHGTRPSTPASAFARRTRARPMTLPVLAALESGPRRHNKLRRAPAAALFCTSCSSSTPWTFERSSRSDVPWPRSSARTPPRNSSRRLHDRHPSRLAGCKRFGIGQRDYSQTIRSTRGSATTDITATLHRGGDGRRRVAGRQQAGTSCPSSGSGA